VLAAIVGYQFIAFVRLDAGVYEDVLRREETSSSIVFYRTIEQDTWRTSVG